MAFSSQNRAYVARKPQSARGVQASGSGARKLRVNGGGGAYERAPREISEYRVDTGGQVGTFELSATAGSYETEFTLETSDIIEAVLQGTSEPPLVLTEANFTSITTTASTIVFASGSPITLGLRIGDVIKLTNHASAGNNDRYLLITALSATTITVAQTLTLNASPDSDVDVVRVGLKLITPPRGSISRRYFTIEEHELDVVVSELFMDCVWHSLQFSMSPNGYLKLNVEWRGTGWFDTATSFFPNPLQSDLSRFTVTDAEFRLGSSTMINLTAFDLLVESSPVMVDAVAKPSAPYSADVLLGKLNVSVSIAGLRSDLSALDDVVAGTPLAFWFKAVGEDSNDDFISVYVPNLKLGSVAKAPMNSGVGPRIQTIKIPSELVGTDKRGGAYDATSIKIQIGHDTDVWTSLVFSNSLNSQYVPLLAL